MRVTRSAILVFVCAATAAILAGVLAAPLHAQSLADLARKTREEKKRQASHKVFTNDDIPAPALSGASETAAPSGEQAGEANPEGQGATPEGADKGGTQTAKPAAGEKTLSPEEEKAKAQAELEKDYRERFAKAREDLSLAERKLDVLQRELNLKQVQYTGDPNKDLQEETFRTEINKWTAEIEAQKQEIEAKKQALADLEEELRKKGLPPGWAR